MIKDKILLKIMIKITNNFKNNSKDNLFTILNIDSINYVCQYLKFIDLIELIKVKTFDNQLKINIKKQYKDQKKTIHYFFL